MPPPPPAVVYPLKERSLNFDHNKSVVRSDPNGDNPKGKLISSATTLIKNKDSIKHIRIVGHTDMTGTAPYNLKLARARANAVTQILVTSGVNAQSISAAGSPMPTSPAPSCGGVKKCEADRYVSIEIDLNDDLTQDQKNAVIQDLNTALDAIWK